MIFTDWISEGISRIPLHSLDSFLEELKLFAKYTACTSEAICSEHHYKFLVMIAHLHLEVSLSSQNTRNVTLNCGGRFFKHIKIS